jgi:hypothetical protein
MTSLAPSVSRISASLLRHKQRRLNIVRCHHHGARVHYARIQERRILLRVVHNHRFAIAHQVVHHPRKNTNPRSRHRFFQIDSGKPPAGLSQKQFCANPEMRLHRVCESWWARSPASTPCWWIRNPSRHLSTRVALLSVIHLRILASRPIFGPGGWVARPRPPFWPHFSRLRESYRRNMLYSRPLHELSWQRRILHASHACTGRDECLPERRSAF